MYVFFKLEYHIYTSIKTLYSVLCWSTFGSDYRLESTWVWRYHFGTPVFGGVSPIIFYISSQALLGWMGSVAAQLFSGLSRDVWWGSSPGSGWATQGHWDLSRSHSCIVLHCLCIVCVLSVIGLLEGEPLPQSEVLSTLEHVFIKDLCSFQFSLNPD